MDKLLTILKLFPLILHAVQAVESSIQIPQSGKQKLDLVMSVIQVAYEAIPDLSKQMKIGDLLSIVIAMVGKIVTILNATGVFKTSSVTK